MKLLDSIWNGIKNFLDILPSNPSSPVGKAASDYYLGTNKTGQNTNNIKPDIITYEDKPIYKPEVDYTNPYNDLISDLPVSTGNYQLNEEGVAARQWQEYMSNTAHQREVADLKAAGLNPVLSANNGASAYQASSGAQNTDIAKIQAATSLKTAEMAMNSAQAVANIQAAAQMGVASMYNGTNWNIAEMNNNTSQQNAIVNAISQLINTGISAYTGYKFGKTTNVVGDYTSHRVGETAHINDRSGGYVNFYR